jgi:hypothetical protein
MNNPTVPKIAGQLRPVELVTEVRGPIDEEISQPRGSNLYGLLPKQFFVVRQFGSSRLALRSRLSDVRLTTKR